MRIVSEISESDIARNRAVKDADWALRDLAANLMRIARGAGKPWEVAQQCAAVINAYQAHWDAVGYGISPGEIAAALDIREEDHLAQFDEIEWGKSIAVRGALQVTASRLLGQKTQEAAGSSELFSGFREIERVREENRRKWLSGYSKPAKPAKVSTRAKSGTPKTPPPRKPHGPSKASTALSSSWEIMQAKRAAKLAAKKSAKEAQTKADD